MYSKRNWVVHGVEKKNVKELAVGVCVLEPAMVIVAIHNQIQF